MAKRTISNSTVTSVVSKKPKHDAAWHAMMERKRRLFQRKKKTNNGEATKCSPGEISLGDHKKDLGGVENSHGETWVRGQLLGKGGFGSVFLAKSKTPISADNNDGEEEAKNTPSVMAVKSAESMLADSLKNEKEILGKLNRSYFVLQCYGDEITKSGDGEEIYYNLLLEYCPGGTLSRRIKESVFGLDEDEVRRYTRDIIRGLSYIHDQGYAHCDIKPGNILLVPDPFSTTTDEDRYRAKIADFGLAKKAYFGLIYDDDYSYSIQGTYPYLSPETVRNQIQETPADIWALGCVVIEMMSNRPVWGFTNRDSLLSRIAHSSELPEIPSDMSKEGRDFLMKCFVKDPDDRWPADMLSLHPFVSVD